jgi:hypothetical protein
MPDPNNTATLLLGAISGIIPTIVILFKMLIAEKDARIKYLEEENLDLREIAKTGVGVTQQAIGVTQQTVARQRGTS